jgi:toxin ParE1/3/4
MKIRFTSRAVRNLSDISDYVRAENPHAATRVRESILSSIKLLADFPELGKSQADGVRKIITRKYNYRVYYAAERGEIVILAIRHPARAGR